jgi:hypothetical protein
MSDNNRPLSREEAEEGIEIMALGNPRLAALFSSEEIKEKAMQILMAGGSFPIWEWVADAERRKKADQKPPTKDK